MSDLLTFEDALAVLDPMGLQVRDPGLMASAVGRPAATVLGKDAYPDLAGKLAALLDSVARSHPLSDGNKRAGWALAVVTIWLNDHDIDYDEGEAFSMVVSVAEGRRSHEETTQWFTSRLRPGR